VTAFAKAKSSGYKIFRMIQQQPTINKVDESAKTLESVKGHIELRDVGFSYPTRPDVPIFKNFSLDIPSGQTVALVGSSGNGKSTIISLIERFYDPNTGKKREKLEVLASLICRYLTAVLIMHVNMGQLKYLKSKAFFYYNIKTTRIIPHSIVTH
jgi:ABC-type transport system involved in cytochrome bd biosynthesis fused ATPase/permease subunit